MIARQEYERWLSYKGLSDAEREELLLIGDDEETIALRFGEGLRFGTAGLRSTMYLGPACMNEYTVAQATAGIAALVLKVGGGARGVAIAYDSRNGSSAFATVCAEVLAAEGVRAYLFDGVRPTPELSFAVRALGCQAGINITASHNPKEYNGYKAYWEDGAQISPEQSRVVADAISRIDVLDGARRMPIDKAKAAGLVTVLDEAFDALYLRAVENTAINRDAIRRVADDLKIVYTPLHGAGHRLVPEMLKRAGLTQLYTVEEQMVLDGNFPTVKKPNPEYADVFSLGIELAEKVGSDLIIATDPDADRVGVMSRTKDGRFATITGNQMGALLFDYVIRARRATGKLSTGAYAVKSIVSTDLASKIAEAQGVTLYDVFTGFKFIGEVIKNHEEKGSDAEFILGFEESYGYLFGSYARDKDAVGATLMIVEMTAYYRAKGMTLSDALEGLYREYGFYKEGILDVYMEGLDGIARRLKVMRGLRDAPPKTLGGVSVTEVTDHEKQTTLSLADGREYPTGRGKSDVLYYTLENGDKVVVRPSGTEPKIKFYFLCHGTDEESLNRKIAAYQKDAEGFTTL